MLKPIIKRIRQRHVYNWFQRDANKNDNLPLNQLSGWDFPDKQFNEIIDHWMMKMNPPIKPGDSIFEIGCGVGAILKHITHKVNNLSISGSDISPNAINKIKKVFPNHKFYCQNMIERHPIPSNSQDHVISIGSLAMYLYKDDMNIAIKEAVRMTKPGGSLCFTHFIENKGEFLGSILHRVNKSYWLESQDELGIENIIKLILGFAISSKIKITNIIKISLTQIISRSKNLQEFCTSPKISLITVAGLRSK